VGDGVGSRVGVARAHAVKSAMVREMMTAAVCHVFRVCGIDGPPGESVMG